MYEMIVDGQSLKDLIYITSVDRTMGPVVKNRVIEVNAYIIRDVLKTVDVLNKLLTGDEQEFIFTDQADRYWLGRLKDKIKLSNSEQWAKVKFEIEISSGVSYAIKPKELSFKDRTSLMLVNNGSDVVYPTFDFKLKADTYMVGAVNKDRAFQFGEPIEASPLKEVTITVEKPIDGHEARRRYVCIDSRVRDLSASSYDMSKINPNWHTAGSFVERKKGMPTPNNGKIKVGRWATHWQTGERIASWVKGKSFDVDETKPVRQSKSSKAYLLKNEGVWIGWLLEQDIDSGESSGFASNNNNSSDMIVAYAKGQYAWHGPCKRFDVKVDCTNFELVSYINYFVTSNYQYGAYYVAVMSGDEPICETTFSTHRADRSTAMYFDAYGKGLNGGDRSDVIDNFWGSITMTKEGSKFTFRVFNDIRKKSYVKTYNVDDKGLKPSHVLIWAGKFGVNPPLYELSATRLKFTALDGLVYIKPTTEKVKEVVNLPDPRYVFKKGDVIRLEMATQKAFVNGIESLNPIAYGSRPIRLKPGDNEVLLDISSDLLFDVDVYYRERYR